MTEDELRGHIGTHMQRLRKAAGFKSAKSFADHVGIPASAYTEYEQGRRNVTFERAWVIADALNCTLDQLGGRESPRVEAEDPDPYRAELDACWDASTAEGKSVILGTARGQRELSLKVSECDRADAEEPLRRAANE